jgi:hypothetical protein
LSLLFDRLCALIETNDVLISEHGYEELADDHLTVKELIAGASEGTIVEEYLDYHKGPCLLLLQRDLAGNPIHAVWGIPKHQEKPAVLITAYRPDPKRWDQSYTRRF